MLTQATTYYDSMAIILILVSLFFLGLLLLVVLFAMRPIKVHDIAPLPPIPTPPLQTVQADYLRAIAWLSKNHFLSQSTRLTEASLYLYGVFLTDYYASIQLHPPPVVGILRCIHTLSIQPLEDDPLRCLVIDTQITRRMVTYDTKTYRRISTQDLGNRAVVYEMCYDTPASRWKLNRFIQELPNGWNGVKSAYPVAWSTQFPTHTMGHKT